MLELERIAADLSRTLTASAAAASSNNAVPSVRSQAATAAALIAAHDSVLAAVVNPEGCRLESADFAALRRAVAGLSAEQLRRGVPPRIRVFFRLVQGGFFEPARQLAADNAVGVVAPRTRSFRWAGGKGAPRKLPLPTVICDGKVFAFLPGFRDPRWSVPNDIYDVSESAWLRGTLQFMQVDGTEWVLAGSAYVTLLAADPADQVELMVVPEPGTAGKKLRIPAQRVRSPEFVTAGDGERLAWAGWQIRTELSDPALRPGVYSLRVRLSQQGVIRQVALASGRRRGVRLGPLLRANAPVAQPVRIPGKRGAVRLVGPVVAADGVVRLVVTQFSGRERLQRMARLLLPQPVRRVLRAVARRLR